MRFPTAGNSESIVGIDGAESTWPIRLDPALIPWLAIAAVAAFVRLVLIDRLPLSDPEAALAFAAWRASQGMEPGTLVDFNAPALSHLMTALVWIFGASDVVARMAPALAGVALSLTPALLSDVLGRRAMAAAGVLIATSPIAIQLSRTVDPAAITAAITMLIVGSAVRIATDRPRWAPWALALGVGLGLAAAPGVVVGLATAGVAAAATWGVLPGTWPRTITDIRSTGRLKEMTGPALLGAGAFLLLGTGALTDLAGIGFAVGPLWGNGFALFRPAPFPTRNLAALLADAWPLLALAAIGFAQEARSPNRVALFVGQWALLLAALAAVTGQATFDLALLPVGPLAVLSGIAVDRIISERLGVRPDGAAWGAALAAFLLIGAVLLGISQSVGAGKVPAPPGVAGVLAVLVAVTAMWWRGLEPRQRSAAGLVLGTLLIGGATVGTVMRVSFGGSPPGTEPLLREQTEPTLREVFRDITITARADGRALAVDNDTPMAVQWYGRDILRVDSVPASGAPPITVSIAPPMIAGSPQNQRRTPWKTTSSLVRSDLKPLAIAQWVVARRGLVSGKASDIIISQ
ncbi:MAG TPA: hypothetical protein VFC51_06430 [Chloroflexota bacterium]|nr:hypothetical protein [Chloroflexota bacterium]